MYARRKQRSLNETVSLALEEWLRQNEFAHIEFRDTPNGRVAFMKNSRLPVWRVIAAAKSLGMDPERVRAHWPHHPPDWARAALFYYEAYPQEIEERIGLAEAETFDALKRRFPQVEAFPVPADVLDEG